MTTTEIDIDAPPGTTHAVLVDASGYPRWLVGAKRIRSVEPEWPAEGSSFHHAVGVGPLMVRDRTTVLSHPGEGFLELEAHIGPYGSTVVRFRVDGRDGGRSSHLSIEEEPADGLVRVLWQTPGRPLACVCLWGRNAVSLQTLRSLVEERAAAVTSPTSVPDGPATAPEETTRRTAVASSTDLSSADGGTPGGS